MKRISACHCERQRSNLFNRLPRVLWTLAMTLLVLLSITSDVHAQALDPSSWQTGATGLRSQNNTDKKTAGLEFTVLDKGWPALKLHGGVKGQCYGKLCPAGGIDLGQITIPNTTGTFSTETSDWAHDEMTFGSGSTSLKLTVSRLTPAILLQSSVNSLRLFTGSLNRYLPSGVGADVAASVGASSPKYVAFPNSSGGISVQPLSSTVTFSSNPAWILVWYGNNSHFADTKRPMSYQVIPTTDAFLADKPMLLVFQNSPSSIFGSSNGGIDLNFATSAGNISVLPLFGREPLRAADTEGWSTGLPTNVTQKINFWTNRLCQFPQTVSETYAYDINSDTSTTTENITFINTCSNSGSIRFAPLPPMLGIVKDIPGLLSFSGTLVDSNLPTEFGPLVGIENTSSYTWSISGLKKYTDSNRIVGTGVVPADLTNELNSQVQTAINSGHFAPWLFLDYMRMYQERGDLYWANPGEIVRDLSNIAGALPDGVLKTNFLTYLRSERNNNPPEDVYYLPPFTGPYDNYVPNGTLRKDYSFIGGDTHYGWVASDVRKDVREKQVPLTNYYALSSYYDVNDANISTEFNQRATALITKGQTALDGYMKERDWASMYWFNGFGDYNFVPTADGYSSHPRPEAVTNANRQFAGLVGLIKLTNKAKQGNPQAAQLENTARALLPKAVVLRLAMAKYPRYLYQPNSNLTELPAAANWQLANTWRMEGLLYNYNWTGAYDDARQFIGLDQYGVELKSEVSGLGDAYLVGFRELTPQLGRLLGDFAKQDVEVLINKVEAWAPQWYTAFTEGLLGGEHDLTYPIDSFQIFSAKAWIQNTSADQLDTYKDISWLSQGGDFFYINKLAETVKAYQGVRWEDQPASNIPCTLTSATWSTQNTTKDTQVSLNVSGSGNCSGQIVNFEVRRNGLPLTGGDIAATIQPNPATFATNSAQLTTTWRAEFNPQIPGTNPDYYFKATVNGSTIESNPRLITVTPISSGLPEIEQELLIYDDVLQSGFQTNTWGASLVSLVYAGQKASGNYSIALDLNNYQTIFFYAPQLFNSGDYTDVEFDIYNVAPTIPNVYTNLIPDPYSMIGNSISVGDYVPITSAWQHVKIPISAYIDTATQIRGFTIHFREPSNNGFGNVLIDNFKFTKHRDVVPPTLTKASNLSLNQINLNFNEKVNLQDAAKTSNYVITSTSDSNYSSGKNPVKVDSSLNGVEVILTLPSDLLENNTYTVSVSNIHDTASIPNLILPNSQVNFTVVVKRAVLNIDANTNIHEFNPMMRGGNFETWMHAANLKPSPGDIPLLVELSKQINPGLVRFAGGLWVNQTIWDRTGTIAEWSTAAGSNHIYNPAQMDSVGKFKRETGSEVMVQVNICNNNPAMWADLVHYTNVEKGYGFKYWELGNELDYQPCPGWANDDAIDSQNYADRFIAYRKAMLAVDPTIKVIGPVSGGVGSAWQTKLLDATRADGKDLDSLIIHWYHSFEGTPNVGCDSEWGVRPEVFFNYNTTLTNNCWFPFGAAGAIVPDDHWLIKNKRRYVEATMNKVKSNVLLNFPDTEFGLTETNTLAGSGTEPAEGNHVAALWFADMLGRWAYNGLDFSNVWALYDDSNFGLTYPDNDANPTKVSIRSTYYSYLMYAKWFGNRMVKSETSDTKQQVTVWASKDTSDPNKLKLLVTNLTGDSVSANLNLTGFNPVSGVYYQLTNPNPLDMTANSSKNGGGSNINGVEVDTTSVESIAASVNAISAKTIANVGPNFVQTLPAYSVTAIVLDINNAAPTPTPQPCNLTSATWSANNATVGSNVNLNVTSSGSCLGKQVNFEVRRNGLPLIGDIAAQLQPSSSTLSVLGGAATTWVAEFNPEFSGTNPQYYFRATVAGGNTIESNPRLITVSQSSGGTPTPTPTMSAGTVTPIPPTGGPTATPTPVGSANINGLNAIYYDNIDFTGPSITRVDPNVNFSWGNVSPNSEIGIDTFSARWVGQVTPQYSETYSFYTITDDGVRLWVNDQLVVDSWINQGATERSGTITLTAGQKYNIKMEYFENTGDAIAQLSWSSPSTTKQIIPTSQLTNTVATPAPVTPTATPTPVPCSLTSATWSSATTTEGSRVNLNISGNSNCAGKQVSFEVRRNGTLLDDISANIQPQVASISASLQASTTWVAEFDPLRLLGIPLGDPQYYFKATVQGGNTIESNPRLINVIQAQGGTGTTTLPADTDWYTVGGNYQRTSWVSEEVRGDFNVEWYQPIEPYIPYKVQPIFTNNTAFISTSKGLYAFDLTSTSTTTKVKWVYPTELPLGNSPTVVTVNNILTAYVGGYDKKIHAIDANTGTDIPGYTPYEAEAGFETNPLVINNIIYAGNRDGKFYALNAITGAKLWDFPTAGPILFSAAFKNNTLYFASNDSYAYAVNATTGEQVWKSAKLPGAGFHSFWPVIYTEKSTGKDYVIFDSGENYRFNELSLTIEETAVLNAYNLPGAILPTGNVSGDWAPGTVTMDASASANYLANSPYRRTVFVLDSTNGQEFTFPDPASGKAAYAPFNWSGVTQAGSKYPPLVNGVDGVYYQQTSYSTLDGWTTRGAPVGWKFGTQYVSKVAQGNTPDTYASDEPTVYSSGGKLIYVNLCCDRQAAAFDITIPYGQPNRSWPIFGYDMASNVKAPGYQLMYDDGTVMYSNMDGWQVYSGKNQSKNGVYGKHGTTQSPPVPYNGKLYILKGNSLLAFSSTGTDPKQPLSLANIVSTQNSTTPPTTVALQQRLATEVQKIIDAGHLRPGYFPQGISDQYGVDWYNDDREFGLIFDYFSNPSDTVITLLQALPHLSPALQSQVRTYLQSNYGPGSTYDITRIAHIGWGTGAKRETFETPPDLLNLKTSWGHNYKQPLNPAAQPSCVGCGYSPYVPSTNFYAAWKYAQTFGNAKIIFDSMVNKLEPPLADTEFIKKPYWLNQSLAGHLGYLNLRQMAGYSDDDVVRANYNHMLSLRTTNFLTIFKDTPFASGSGTSNSTGWYNRVMSISRNFMFLVPEISEVMSQNTKADIQISMDEYNYVGPYWFVPGFDNTVGEGTFQPLYDSPSLFQAKAYILKQPYSELVKYLDVPAFEKGDLFYIQNLTAALSAPATYSGSCTLTSLNWGSSTAVVNTQVTLTARASGDCSTTQATFEVDQNGLGGGKMIDPTPKTLAFNGSNQAQVTWTTQHTPVIIGTDPQYTFKVSLDNGTNWSSNSELLTVTQSAPSPTPTLTPVPTVAGPTPTSGPTSVPGPYGGTPVSIPGTIQAENFDYGGEGVAYHDLDGSNSSRYRLTEGVDIETTTDTGGGYNVGWIQAGEWMNYSVNVAQTGTYTLTARVASSGLGGTFHIMADTTNVSGTLTVPDTLGWQTYTNVTQTVSLTAGNHVLKFVADTSGASSYIGNLNYLTLQATSQGGIPTATPSATVAPTAIPTPLPAGGTCTLTTASWNTNSVTSGTNVTLNIASSGSCSGQQANLTIFKNGTFGGQLTTTITPNPVSIASNSATASWTSEYTADALSAFGPNQYYFTASLGTQTITSSPLLDVAQAQSGTGLQVNSITTNTSTYSNSQVPKFEKFEASFQIANSVATNFQMPYDPNPPAGINQNGISVNGVFTSPTGKTYTQPAFYYQDFDYQVKNNTDEWFYPNGKYAWKVRFSPNEVGNWQYRLTAQDTSGTAQSTMQSFTVTGSSSHGFVKVSPKDSRYFEFDDGTYFPALGVNSTYGQPDWSNPTLNNQPYLQELGQNGVQLVRAWISGWSVWGSSWNPWYGIRNDYDGYVPRTGLMVSGSLSTPATPSAELTLSYTEDANGQNSGSWFDACRFIGGFQAAPAVKQNTNYHIMVHYKGFGLEGPRVVDAANYPGRDNFGLVAKVQNPNDGNWHTGCYNYGDPANGIKVTNYGKNTAGNTYSYIEGNWNSGNRDFLPMFYLALENANNMATDPNWLWHPYAYIDKVYITEDLGGCSASDMSKCGPNIVTKPSMEHLNYFMDRNAEAFDRTLDLAHQNNVYFKLVIMEKNDELISQIGWDGKNSADDPNNFYGNNRTMTPVRWLQQAYWRYLQARWGYSPNIQSWELVNEGDPWNGNHYALADELGKYINCTTLGINVAAGNGQKCISDNPNKHMVTTSFWHSFPATQFWGNASYPNIDYADLHAYISTSAIGVSSANLAAMQWDSALYHLGHSSLMGGWNLGKPIMRGEAGIDDPAIQAEQAGLSRDTQGIWLHKYLWATLDPGGMMESYWWQENTINQPGPDGKRGLYEIYGTLYNFIKDIPLSNGNYKDAATTVSNTNLRVVGQKDAVNGKAHLWIDNKTHTWNNVVNSPASIANIPAATVTIPGMPAGNYTTSWYDTYTGTISRTENLTASAGTITLNITNLATDTAVKLVNTTLPSPTATIAPTAVPTPVPCTLASATWSIQNTTQNTPVTLNVSGNNCAGQTVNFEVRRNGLPLTGGDIAATIQPNPATFATNSAQLTTTWRAEFNPQIPGTNPDYYFKATAGSSTIESNPRLLNVTQAQGGTASTDWPMFMGNPQHTGTTTSTFTPVLGTANCAALTGVPSSGTCIQPRWKKGYSEWPNGFSQPVISGNTVFQANMDGKLYAYDTETGNERWIFDAGSPIAVTPAVFEGKIYFGDFAGNIYALNIADKTPAFAPIVTQGAIYSSPVVVRENGVVKVFIGSNEGKLYGFNGENGNLLFTPFDTGSYIYSNPAYSNGRVFFASENMNAYAIDSSTGAEVWRKKLEGESNRGDHPVVVSSSNTVLFRSVPRYSGTNHGLKDLYEWGDLAGSLKSRTLKDILTAYQTQMLANPANKSTYLFNVSDGSEVNSFVVRDATSSATLSTIPLNTWYANGQNQPLVMDQKDLVFGAFGGYVRLDTVTKEFSTIINFQPVRGDEYTSSIIADGWLYGGFVGNIARIKFAGQTDKTGSIMGDSNLYNLLHGCKDCGTGGFLDGYALMDPTLSTDHWEGYTGDGATNIGNFFVVANGHAYWSSNGWLYGF